MADAFRVANFNHVSSTSRRYEILGRLLLLLARSLHAMFANNEACVRERHLLFIRDYCRKQPDVHTYIHYVKYVSVRYACVCEGMLGSPMSVALGDLFTCNVRFVDKQAGSYSRVCPIRKIISSVRA